MGMDILGPLPKMTNGNQFVVVMIDRYSNLTQTGPASKKSEAHIVNIFYDDRIVPYEAPAYVFTNNDTQVVSTFFETICIFL